MENLTQIEKKLIEKSKIEINEITERFISDLKNLESKYNNKSSFYSLEMNRHNSDTQRIGCIKIHEFKRLLNDSIYDKLGDGMLSKKSSELLTKLEIL